MFLLRLSVAALVREIAAGTLIPRLQEQTRYLYDRVPSPGEQRSWERSLPVLAKELEAAGLDQVEMLIEYQLPLTSRRVDVVLLGKHPGGGPSCLIVELKQWSSASLVDPEFRLVTVDGLPREKLHPQEQARRYVDYVRDFNQFLEVHPTAISGMAFLHNATTHSIEGLHAPQLKDLVDIRLFAGDQSAALQRFLRARLSPEAAPQVTDDFLQARTAPSKQLLRLVNEEIDHCGQFILLDEQEVAFQTVVRAVRNSQRGDRKEVVIVTGGPGSGKSVIAIALLAWLAKQGMTVVHATGSRSFTLTLRSVVGQRRRRAQEIFRYFNTFGGAEPNCIEVLVADEAHRIRATSNYRWTAAAKRSSLSQVDELIRTARVPVFLLDEYQVVRRDEIGTVQAIMDAAERNGATVHKIDLYDQFRCGGSQAYVTWVKRLLGLDSGGPIVWEPDGLFDLRLADSPEQMEQTLKVYHDTTSYTARMTAGYCWKWSDPRPDGTLVDDVVIDDWHRPWNLKSERSLNGIPAAPLWATDPAGFGQVGCIYTAQGFEYDYNGVILGPDLVWRTDHWQANPRRSADPWHRGAKNFDLLVRNVYKVLLTRGMIGCIIYSVDPETQSLLSELGVSKI